MPKLQLYWQILIALALGVLFGIFAKEYTSYVTWMGELFLRGLKMIIIPLIFSSLIAGVANIGSAENLGRLGLKTIGYYLITSTFAILTGLILVNLVQPGAGADLGLARQVDDILTGRPLSRTLMEVVPENIFQAFVRNDMLAIIFFAILFGFFSTRVAPAYSTTIRDFFNAVFAVMMQVTLFIIRFTPLGVFGIVAGVVAAQQDLPALIASMGKYMVVVVGGLAFHAFITLPLLLKFLGKIHPVRHVKAVATPLITAFSTSSSSATLPLTMQAVEHNAGVSNKVTSFTLPLGATINMDGTALYECVAAMFIAQAYGIELSFIQQIVVVITALLASIGAAGIPMAGLVMISVILTAVGLPLEGVGLILAVDRILDMFRTTVNVWSDTCGAGLIARSEGETLKV